MEAADRAKQAADARDARHLSSTGENTQLIMLCFILGCQDEQLVTLYRKLESMVKLNKTLNAQKEEIKLKLSSRSTPSDD